MLGELALGNEPAAVMHEVRQHAELVAGQLDRRAVAGHARGAGIERDGAGAKLGRDLPAGPPDECPETRQDLFHPKGLRDIVVSAPVDPLHLLVPAAPRRQEQHGHRQALLAPSPQHREPIHLWQAEVQHHSVVALRPPKEVGALAVGGAVDGIPGLAEGGGQLPRQSCFILDYEHPHLTVIAQPNLNGT